MPTHFFPLTILTQEFEDETYLSEALNFYEISRFSTNLETAVFNVRLNAEQILKDVYANELHARLAPEAIEIVEIDVNVEPPRRTELWRAPVTLKFHVLSAAREDGYRQAYVPVFKLAVISKKTDDFTALVKSEIISTIKRDGWTKSLRYLRWLEKTEKVSLHTEEIALTLPTARRRAIAEETGTEEEKSVLAEVGTNLNAANLKAAYESEKQVELLAEIFRAKQSASVLLVGAAGVGKTAVFHELVRRRQEFGLEKREFWATSGARLIAGQSGFGMWQERCRRVIDEAGKKDAVVHLGNLVELTEVGKSEASAQGIASFLRPKIARGELVAVCECTPEQLPVLERRDPNLLAAFQKITFEEPDKATSLKILAAVATGLSRKDEKQRKIDPAAVKTIESVHRRFSTYSAFPGRPVRFLRSVFQELGAGDALDAPKIYRAFSNETGLPEMLLNDAHALDLARTEKFFAEKVIGQPDAVALLTKLIATVKTKLTRPRRPVASLLFIGPTGVGKTELTKALAEFFFSDRARLIRFDMSEFSNALAIQRLFGGTGEAEGQLTAKVREQPFSVVLLDEFEKAHQSFFDLLLQILGEGRLTDAGGRVADFTNSIIVMTSNLGASEFQRGKSGFTHDSRERQTAVKHFDQAVKSFLRPEIYNRIDRIVPFAPLDAETVGRIAEIEIENLRRRDGLQFRPVHLEIEREALNYLTETGYDIRYGARPLKRTLERELLAPLAAELNQRDFDEKLNAAARLENGRIALEFTGADAPKKSRTLNNVLAVQTEKTAVLRRRAQKFAASYKLTELRDEIYQIGRLQALRLRGKWLTEEDKARIERKPKIESFLEALRKFGDDLYEFEDKLLLKIYGRDAGGETENYAARITERENLLQKFLFELLSFQYPRPDEITITFFSENNAAMINLLRLYLNDFKQQNSEVKRLSVFSANKDPKRPAEKKMLFGREVWRQEIVEIERFFAAPHKDALGILMGVEGNLALPRYGAESGIHRFSAGVRQNRVLVGSTEASFEKFETPDELTARDSVKGQFERRFYDPAKPEMKDFILNRTFSLENVELQKAFSQAIAENLVKTAENLIL